MRRLLLAATATRRTSHMVRGVVGEGGRERARGRARGQMEFFPPIFQNGAPKMPTEDSTLLQLIARRASIRAKYID
jgi:hypothetical protein